MAVENVPHFVHTVAPVVNHYGYLAVGILLFIEDFGVLVPGETTLVATALFAGLGHLNLFVVMVVALTACFAGDNIGYLIGRYGGHPLIERYGKYIFLPPKRFAKAERLFNRHGAKIVFVARFINGLRETNGIIAGVSKMGWRTFSTFNFIGALLWVITWSMIGYFGGSHIILFIRFGTYITIVTIITFIGYVVYERIADRQTLKE